MADDFVSNLPAYQATRSTDFPKFLVVMCGRKECPGVKGGVPFLVAEKEWLRPLRVQYSRSANPTIILGRSCPYCFKAGRLPLRSEIG